MWRKRSREDFEVQDKVKPRNIGKLCLVYRFNFKIGSQVGFGWNTIILYWSRGKYPKMLQCDIYACPFFGVQISKWCNQSEERYCIFYFSQVDLQQENEYGESISLAHCSIKRVFQTNQKMSHCNNLQYFKRYCGCLPWSK